MRAILPLDKLPELNKQPHYQVVLDATTANEIT